MSKPVFLCGMPGSGKTSIGRALAAHLSKPFIDTDRVVETFFGLSVKEIFAQKGETAFRNEEAETVKNCLQNREAIISLGGGALMNAQTLQLVVDTGLLVWIDAPLKELVNRLTGDINRPLLYKPDGSLRSTEELEDFLRNLLVSRQSHYLKAQVHFKTKGSVQSDALALTSQLRPFL